MRRRQFIALLGGAMAAWPVGARGEDERVRRIGLLMNLSADDPEALRRYAALLQALQQFGLTDGRNVNIETRWGAGNRERYRLYAKELADLRPDAIIGVTAAVVRALQDATSTIPIVFVGVIDPVGGGLVASLARPGGNTTGFTNFEYSISGKWLELLKQIAPETTRVGVIRDASVVGGIGQLAAIQTVAPSFGVELSLVDVRDPTEIERAISVFARLPNGGLIATASTQALVHRELIVKLAARHRLPAVYPYCPFVTGGGLIYYGPDQIDQYRRAAEYVHRILRGEKAMDLPVQAPNKFELAINLKTARALGITVPPTLLARADEVIE